MTFDVWFLRQKSSNEKWEKWQDSHNGHKPTVYNAFSQISGHFCHHFFTRFSLISQSILNRFSCNFAGTTCNYSGDCPEKFVKFEQVFLKLLVRLVVNLLEYFKIYSFRRQFRHQFSTVYHVILRASLDLQATEDQPRIYLNEDLSKVRSELLFLSRKAKRGTKIMDCWSYDGRIVVKDLKGKISTVTSEKELITCFYNKA